MEDRSVRRRTDQDTETDMPDLNDPNVAAAVAAQNAQIQNIYSALGKNLQNNVGATNQVFAGAQQGTQGAYDSGLTDLKSITDRLSSRVHDSASRLGLGVAVPQATLGMEGTLANQASRMVGNRTAALDALGSKGAAYGAIAQRAVGDSQREGAQAKLDYANKLKNVLYKFMGDEEGARGKVDIAKLSGQQKLQSEKMNYDSRSNQSALQVKQAQVQQQTAQNAANANFANQQAARAQQLLMAKAQMDYKNNNPLALLQQQYKAGQIENMDARTQKLLGLLDGSGGDITSYGSGQAGVQDYIQSNELDPHYLDVLNTITDNAEKKRQEQSASSMGALPAYDYAQTGMKDVLAGQGGSGIDPVQLSQLLQIWYNQARPPKRK